MHAVSRDRAADTEGALRLHAIIRTVLSPGIWFVLAVQIGIMFSLRWRAPADASPAVSVLLIFLAASTLMFYFYLQAGAFHALTLKRDVLSIADILLAGRKVFGNFLWLSLKTTLLFALAMNVLVLLGLIVTGKDFKNLMEAGIPLMGPLTGVLAFIFVYWLPFVFVRREFRLLPSLRASLQLAWSRMSYSAFLALLVLVPPLAIEWLPAAQTSLFGGVAAMLVSGILGWIAYIYCIAVQQRNDFPLST